jgi:putative tryptophan/tyrosine transport system substrate-binding protein
MSRRELMLLLGGGMTAARTLHAQQKAMPVIGFLGIPSPGPYAPFVVAFREGLREAGYVDGKNLTIEYRWAEGRDDRLPALAADLVDRNVDVIATAGGPSPTLAAKSATSTIPIVFISADPIGDGLVASLARPKGNLTGLSILAVELNAKRVELLSELVPRVGVIALLVNPGNPQTERALHDTDEAARTKGAQISVLEAGTKSEIDAAFASLARLQAGAMLVQADPVFTNLRETIVGLASRYAVPAIYPLREFAAAGGLISYGSSLLAAYRDAGIYAGKILKGAKPADLPVQQPTRFELVVNLKTASALGLTVPQSILARADEVIE